MNYKMIQSTKLQTTGVKAISIVNLVGYCYNTDRETKSEAAYSPLTERNRTLRTKERRVANVYYI